MRRSIRISAIALLSLAAGQVSGQVCHNLYPYAAGVVDDNNGHDLFGFLKSNKTEANYKGGKIDDFSGGTWGYIQVNNARVPSINILQDKYKTVVLNHGQAINATVVIAKSKDGIQATWWARQCNNPQGPLFWKKTDDDSKLDPPAVRYGEVTRNLETKKFTIVEYNDSIYNERDYDQLLKNYMLIENGIIKDVNDYKMIVDFYNNFLSKFSYTDDPVLEHKSFVTFLSSGKTRYVGYFNIVNGKLAGHLEVADLQFEDDMTHLVNKVMKKMSSKTVYVYGDDIFGLEKTFLKYKHEHHDITFARRNTNMAETFNKDK